MQETILQSIGRTPLVRLRRLTEGLQAKVYVKVEAMNPAGSIKDRVGIAMIAEAERSGRLGPGGTIIEATAGNTGVGLAMAAAVKGYRCIFVLPDKMSEEKVRLLAGARCTLFPIRWNEPFGLVMLESLACGTPVLAFREGAAPEVIEHGVTGFLCDDETDMAEAIAAAGTLDRSACRAATEGYFAMDRCVAEHLELFEDLLGG